mgnify:CR=1 FL=1
MRDTSPSGKKGCCERYSQGGAEPSRPELSGNWLVEIWPIQWSLFMPEIHPSAQVSPGARLAEDVTVGAFSIIDGPAEIGEGCEIGAQVWIHGEVSMGPGNKVGYGSIIGADPQDLGFDSDARPRVAQAPCTRSGPICLKSMFFCVYLINILLFFKPSDFIKSILIKIFSKF